MIQLTGYQIITQIYESNNSQIYRGVRQGDNQAVILKLLQSEYPTPQQLTNYRQEYEITHSLDLTGVIKVYELIPYHNTLVMVLEDFGGQSLKDLSLAGMMNLDEFLQLAIQLSDILGQVHQQQIMHKDINPANMVYNPMNQLVKLIDFGISSRLSREYTTFRNPNILEGTLAYISPEQTGRMNRVMDYRTDLYSLGVTFYELLTGKLPFEESDSMALIHAHLAKIPVPPLELKIKNEKLEKALLPTPYSFVSDIIMKLLAKNAEDRYQSAHGLKWDLERVREYGVKSMEYEIWRKMEGGSRSLLPTPSAILPLGQRDFSGRFQIPQKLYGREAEVDMLLNAFERVAGGPPSVPPKGGEGLLPLPVGEGWGEGHAASELLLIAGYSGVGKSVLVHEIHKPITARRGYFVSGKYDQFQRNVPYYALMQALNEFCNHLLTEAETTLAEWKQKILAAVGNNGQLLIEVIPHLEWVIGKQPAVPQVGAQESRNRFNMVFQKFIKAICTSQHPLVMFIDDLQWADSASLELFKQMLLNTAHLLIIGAYRENEVDVTHPFMRLLDELRQENVTIQTMNLPNLTISNMMALVTETLQCETQVVSELVNLLYEKTEGNAFFVTQCLISLYEQGQLKFDYATLTWQWDVGQIRGLNINDNVVELMASKLVRLDETTQTMLKWAACVGNKFTLATLALIAEQLPHEVLWALWPSVENGLVLPLDENYEQILLETYDRTDVPDSQFKFLHDRVQQAAYSLIAESDRVALHLKIGRLWLADATLPPSFPPESPPFGGKRGTQGGLEERLFDIVNQLNAGRELIHEEADKLQLARLNLQASRKAKNAIAYQTASNCVTIALTLLPADGWTTHYELMLDLMTELGSCQFLTGRFTAAETTFNLALDHAQTNLEKGHLYSMLVALYSYQLNFKQWAVASSQGLQALGLEIPMEGEAVVTAIGPMFGQIQAYLADKEIASLLELPELTDKVKLKSLEFCGDMLSVAYITGNFNLYTLLDLKMVNVSLESGNSIFASFAYSTYGIIKVIGFSDYQQGYEWGRLGLRLMEKYPFSGIHVRNQFAFATFTNHWRQPAKSSLSHLLQVYSKGIEMGEVSYAAYASPVYIMVLFFIGVDLAFIEQETLKYLAAAEKAKDKLGSTSLFAILYYIFTLKGQVQFQDSAALNQETVSQRVRGFNYKLGLFRHLFQSLKAEYLMGHYDEAWLAAQEAATLVRTSAGMLIFAEFHFYHALILVVLWPTWAEAEQAAALETMTAHHTLIKTWRDNCPANFAGMELLLSAEIARLQGKQVEITMWLYDQAIAAAKESEFIHLQALANELAAKFWLGLGQLRFADLYLREAHYAYQHWGANVKVKQLEEQYPQLRFQSSPQMVSPRQATAQRSTTSSTSSTTSQTLDLASVMKAAQTISGEIKLARLLEKMMVIVLENTGAQRGLLILRQGNQWLLQAEANENKVEVLQAMPVEAIGGKSDLPKVSLTMLRYVEHTQQPLVLDDARQAKQFAQTAYVRKFQPKSVLCVPLINQGQIMGGIYLENNLIFGAFTPDRLEILNLLSLQMAISLENAQLYQEATKLSALQRELAIAHEMQNSLLQPAKPSWPGIEVVCYSTPAKEVGGDFYKYHLTPEKSIFAIGDVSGKGVPASLLMATSLSQLDASLVLNLEAADRMVYLDTVISPYTKPKKQNCAMCYVEIGSKEEEVALTPYSLLPTPYSLTIINAGCIPPYIKRVDGTIESLELGGFALGQGLGAQLGYQSVTRPFSPGDMVILTSDGVVEANDMHDEMLGFDRLELMMQQGPTTSAAAMLEYLKQAIADFTQGAEPHDDLTIMVIQLSDEIK